MVLHALGGRCIILLPCGRVFGSERLMVLLSFLRDLGLFQTLLKVVLRCLPATGLTEIRRLCDVLLLY